MSAKAQGFE